MCSDSFAPINEGEIASFLLKVAPLSVVRNKNAHSPLVHSLYCEVSILWNFLHFVYTM